VLEARGHERADREDDRQDLVHDAAAAVAQPHGHTHQRVTHDAQEECLDRVQRHLGKCNVQRLQAQRALAERILLGQEHDDRCQDRADQVAGPDDGPVAQQLAGADLLCSPGHDDQVVAREQLCAGHDNEDEAEAEDEAAQQAVHAVWQRPAAGPHRSRIDRPRADEGAGQDRQCEHGQEVQVGLLDADRLSLVRHVGRHEGIDVDLAVSHMRVLPCRMNGM